MTNAEVAALFDVLDRFEDVPTRAAPPLEPSGRASTTVADALRVYGRLSMDQLIAVTGLSKSCAGGQTARLMHQHRVLSAYLPESKRKTYWLI